MVCSAGEWQPVCCLSSPWGYIKEPMSSFPSFYVSCQCLGMTVHGKTGGRVGGLGKLFRSWGLFVLFFRNLTTLFFKIFSFFFITDTKDGIMSFVSYQIHINHFMKKKYIYRQNYFICVKIATNIDLALCFGTWCFVLPSKRMEEKQGSQRLPTVYVAKNKGK